MTFRYRVAAVFLTGFFIDCVNIFMPAVALPRISAELAVSAASSAWVSNAYILGLTLVMPLSTWLAGRWGARALLTLSMLVFALAAWGCGQADSFAALVAWRFVQGLAGGLLIPVGQALTFNLFQGAERTRVSTLVMAVALLAPALSPSLGGMIVDHGRWPWVFQASVPLALLAAAMACCWLGATPRLARPRPDLKGLVLVAGALACLLLGLSAYGAGYSAGVALAWLAAGLICGLGYRAHYKRTGHGVLELSLLASARLRVAMLVYQAVPGVFTGVNLLNLFYLQEELHLSAGASGLCMLVYAGGAFAAMLLGGRAFNRVGARRLLLLALLLHSLGIALLVQVDSALDSLLLIAAYGLMGCGGGLAANTAQTTALLDFEGERTQQASVLWNINRQMAFSVGAALFLMLFNLLHQHLDTARAYHLTFALAALCGLLPVLRLTTLPKEHTCHA